MLFSLCYGQTPTKPIWPLTFDCTFGLTIPLIPGVTTSPLVNISSHFYYDFTKQASLIDYPTNCIPLYPGSESIPCKLWFDSQYGCVYQDKTYGQCVLFPGVGTIPPNFLANFNFSTTSLQIDYYGVAHYSNFWVSVDGFQYWTDKVTGADIALIDGGNLLWYFTPLQVRAQDPALFKLPTGLQNCPAPLSQNAFTYLPMKSLLKFSS